MTLCIACHSADGAVVGLSDRMLTVGDKRPEHPVEKFYQLHPGIFCQWAGGNSLADAIANAAKHSIKRQYGAAADSVTVQRAAQCVREAFEAARIIEGAYEILPRFLIAGVEEYHVRRPHLPKETVREIERSFGRWEFPVEEDPAFIVYGADAGGTHIYKVFRHAEYKGRRRTRMDVHDSPGFATIGSNFEPAEDVLYTRQSWRRSFGEAVMLAYIAGRYAVNPDEGVGLPRDMVIVGPGQTDAFQVNALGMARLDSVYEATIVAGHGGIEIALGFAAQFRRDPALGIVMPPTPPDTPAPEPPAASSDGP